MPLWRCKEGFNPFDKGGKALNPQIMSVRGKTRNGESCLKIGRV